MNYAERQEKEGGREGGREKFAWAGAESRRGTELDVLSVRPSVRPFLPPSVRSSVRPPAQWDSIDQLGRHFTILLNYRNAKERARTPRRRRHLTRFAITMH